MSKTISKEILDKYSSDLNDYFMEKVKDNEKLNNYMIDIYYYPYINEVPLNNKENIATREFVKNLSTKLQNSEYDMVLLDEKILFSEMAMAESEKIKQFTNKRYPSLELLHDLSKYINKKDLEFHDPMILSGGMYKDKLIGIPFEYDFDVMYFHKEEPNTPLYYDIQELIENMESYTWNELINEMEKKSLKYRISLNDDNDVLNFVVEYTSNLYNLSSEYDPNFIKIFYNDTSIKYYTDFGIFVQHCSEREEARYQILKTLDDIFYDFMVKNTTIFTGKASSMMLFDLGKIDYIATLPPKYKSVTTHKYLVTNKKSKINPDILAEVALILTSKEAQLLRAKKYSSVPTFDFTQKNSDSDLQNYCQEKKFICDALEKINKLHVRDIFKSKYMVPFFDIEYIVPTLFKNFFRFENVDDIRMTLINMNEFVTNNLNLYGYLSILVIFLTITFCVAVIIMTHKIKDHPYMKIISPLFCNLIVIGCILNMMKLFKFIPPFSLNKIKFFLVLETLGTNLIYISMFAVTYRIYHIIKTKSFMSFDLNNTRLLIYVLIAVSVAVIYSLVITFTCDFYYESFGSINEGRVPVGYYSHFNVLKRIYQIYLGIIFISLIFMIIATGSCSKKFGDIFYTFVIFCINISDYLVEHLITKLNGGSRYPLYFFLVISLSCFLHFACVFILVGMRIFLIMTNHYVDLFEESESSSNDVSQYVALRSRINNRKINRIVNDSIDPLNNNYYSNTYKSIMNHTNSYIRVNSNTDVSYVIKNNKL
ncbi:hypothetical protein PIROE2DRAFT_6354 [Piromyces sp. E2]|nr:hypothetical protein PIROE2DRAFT_6354 [Piromyces sp. E2]|eukprot:OUM66410.1 hypothetical protein PIROE2DRAFT_6354 [Piromyces sp. E2]